MDDHRFNAFLWAFDVRNLCSQIGYSYCWMKAYADHYKTEVSEGDMPWHTDFHVSYYADNCITRIDSSRDKTALMVWAYYCAFDPEKPVLVYEDVTERLRSPKNFGLVLEEPESFLKCLKLLSNEEFKTIEDYRHLKIHRREPRYEMYGVKPHHDWPYLFPLANQPGSDVRYEPRRSDVHLADYKKLEEAIRNSLLKILESASGCFRILSHREPFRKKPSR